MNINTSNLEVIKCERGSELAVLEAALARLAPGSKLCYHRGLSGSAPIPIKRAAYLMHERGACLLAQRFIGHDKEGQRIVEYLAIRAAR